MSAVGCTTSINPFLTTAATTASLASVANSVAVSSYIRDWTNPGQLDLASTSRFFSLNHRSSAKHALNSNLFASVPGDHVMGPFANNSGTITEYPEIAIALGAVLLLGTAGAIRLVLKRRATKATASAPTVEQAPVSLQSGVRALDPIVRETHRLEVLREIRRQLNDVLNVNGFRHMAVKDQGSTVLKIAQGKDACIKDLEVSLRLPREYQNAAQPDFYLTHPEAYFVLEGRTDRNLFSDEVSHPTLTLNYKGKTAEVRLDKSPDQSAVKGYEGLLGALNILSRADINVVPSFARKVYFALGPNDQIPDHPDKTRPWLAKLSALPDPAMSEVSREFLMRLVGLDAYQALSNLNMIRIQQDVDAMHLLAVIANQARQEGGEEAINEALSAALPEVVRLI
ncbi:MAG: hypothetical protein ABH871_02390 [Pseudomonadota bacterium]